MAQTGPPSELEPSSRCLACLAFWVQKLCGDDTQQAQPLPPKATEPEEVEEEETLPTPLPSLPAPAPPAPAAPPQAEARTKKKTATSVRFPKAPSPESPVSASSVRREDPASRAFWCGRWPGARNDYEGEAGFRFLVHLDCEVTALGRPCEPPLMEAAAVSLWHADSQERLVSAFVGPTSRIEGSYAWEPLQSPVRLYPGQEYRLTLRCRANMPDRWSDATATPEEVAANSWATLASFLGGVCKNTSGFPSRVDGDLRRPGIANFKVLLRPSHEPALRDVGRHAFAQCLATSAAAEAQAGAEVEYRLAALAGLVALFVDELQGLSAMALLAAEEELRLIAASAAACSPSGELELAGCGIFESRALYQEMSRASRRSGLDSGLLLVGALTGEVLGLCLRPRAGPEQEEVRFEGGRPLQAWELAEQLSGGLALARSATEVIAYPAREATGLRLNLSAEGSGEPP